jgi:hypothetical protein
VKPQNILLSSEGEVKVTDFGIARSLHVDHGVTQTGTVLGTGEYLSPEQASGKQVSPATDVYSLGVVLWELIAGDVPFTGENFVAVALRHVNEPPPHLRERRTDVSPRLDAAVQRALAKDPVNRFPSMAAFAKELRACLAEPEGTASPLPAEDDLALTLVTPPAQAEPAPVRRRRSARRSRRPLVYALLAVVAAAVAFAAVVLLGGGGHHGASGGGGGSSDTTVQLHALRGYDPEGDGQEHNEVAGLATDGSASTSWTTESYASTDFGGLKHGVGLLLDAGSSVKLAHVTVTTPTPGFTAEIQSGDSSSGPFAADSSSQTVAGTRTFTLNGATAQYYVIWITQLPGTRAEISDVTATR